MKCYKIKDVNNTDSSSGRLWARFRGDLDDCEGVSGEARSIVKHIESWDMHDDEVSMIRMDGLTYRMVWATGFSV